VEPPLLLKQQWPILPQMLYKLAQDHDGVVGVDGGAPGGDVGVDEASGAKKTPSPSVSCGSRGPLPL
jgi:hypothetical protein